YGANPPAQGVLMLSGPLMDADGIDNPRYDSLGNQLCDYSVNGRYFDDDIVDNERLGMTGFKYTNNLGIPYYMQDPRYAEEYYRIMSKPDSVRFILGTPTDLTFWFFYPGMSDSTNWGTQCTPVYNNWTEETSSDAPGDRRGVGVYGPFTFHPGDVQEIDFAYVWARDYVNPNPASVEKLRQMADQIKEAFESNHLSNGQQFYAVDDLKNQKKDLKLYPNPATSHMVIDLTGEKQLSDLQIINTHGSVVLQKKDVGGKVSVNISDLPRGIYLVKVKTRSDILTTKFIKK
ncbi:MAG: T9SS type A sorting domain-containing protein, partial [Syntrophothermus sp.]